MKPVTVILLGMFLLVFFLTGCAGSKARIRDKGSPPDVATGAQAAATGEIPAASDAVMNETAAVEDHPEVAEQEAFEILSTPFGDVKRKKSLTSKAATVPPPEKAYIDEEGEFKIISTPFGYVKRKIKQAEEIAPPATEKQETGASLEPEAMPAVLPEPETEPDVSVAVLSEESVDEDISREADQISFDFDDAELEAVIRLMADFLKLNYIIDPGVTGKVTIHTAGNLNADDVFPIFFQTLEVNGLTAVKEGNIYRISKFKDASRLPVSYRSGGDPEKIPPEERIVLQIIPLKFISAQEVTKVITPFVSADGTIVSEGTSNTLLVVDKGINIFKILKLVETFDVSVFEKTNYRFYALENADAEEAAKALGEILPPPAAGGKGEVKFIPIKWLNALLIVGASPDIFDQAEDLIRHLDIPSEGAQPQIYVYFVKNGMAIDLGDTLRAIFGAKGESRDGIQRESVPTNPFARDARVPVSERQDRNR